MTPRELLVRWRRAFKPTNWTIVSMGAVMVAARVIGLPLAVAILVPLVAMAALAAWFAWIDLANERFDAELEAEHAAELAEQGDDLE